jgi:DNA-binding transcriptional MerR regulator
MVKSNLSMLIKQFCEASGLPRDTVRFYVKRGLLTPEIGRRPGNRYQIFDAEQVERAKLIKTAQRLGFSLKQIAELAKLYDARDIGSEAKKSLLRTQIDSIAEKEQELAHMRKYLSAKLSWVEKGEVGKPPSFSENNFGARAANDTVASGKRGRRRSAPAGGRAPGRARVADAAPGVKG